MIYRQALFASLVSLPSVIGPPGVGGGADKPQLASVVAAPRVALPKIDLPEGGPFRADCVADPKSNNWNCDLK